MKLIKKVIIIVILIVIILTGLIVGKGYLVYKNAINEESLQDKVNSIKEERSYTNISQLSQIYLDAVVSTEDRRFYIHRWNRFNCNSKSSGE